MNRLDAVLRRAVADLSALARPCALVGGLAVSVRTEPRFTRDVDLAVAVRDDDQAEALVRDLSGRGYAIVAMVEHEGVSRLATVRLAAPDGEPDGVVVDLLFASSGIEPEIVAGAEALEVLPDMTVPVARTGHLIALKLLSRTDARPLDGADLVALAAVATDVDVDLARAAVALITDRGYARGRDLTAALEALP